MTARPNLMAAVLLGSLFLAVNLTILVNGGIRMGGDSPRYLSRDENSSQGGAATAEGRQQAYMGYVALVAFYRRTGIGLPGVIATQLGLALLAAVALYDLGRRLHGNRAGLLAAGLFVVNPDIARWNAFILTDSLYISVVILCVWCVHTTAQRKQHWYFIAAAALMTAVVLRPNGLFLMAAGVLYLLGQAISRRSLRWLAMAALVLTLTLGATAISRRYHASDPEHPGLTLRYGITGIEAWSISMPPDSEPLQGEWADALAYVSRHPFASFRLGVARVAIELIHVRPFYSLRHNLLLLLTLPGLYLLALMGLKLNRNRSLTHLLLLAIAAHLLVVAITFADWDGRFLLYIIPLISLFSACAIVSLIELYFSKRALKAKPCMTAITARCVSE